MAGDSHIGLCRVYRFSAAHLVDGGAVHGHTYRLRVTLRAAVDDRGYVLPAATMDERIGSWLAATVDHTTIVGKDDSSAVAAAIASHNGSVRRPVCFLPSNPTLENLGAWIADALRNQFNATVAIELSDGTGLTVQAS